LSGPPDPATRERLRKILVGVTIGVCVLGALGFLFVRWMMKLPPGTLKPH
jgi:hypothetical protein